MLWLLLSLSSENLKKIIFLFWRFCGMKGILTKSVHCVLFNSKYTPHQLWNTKCGPLLYFQFLLKAPFFFLPLWYLNELSLTSAGYLFFSWSFSHFYFSKCTSQPIQLFIKLKAPRILTHHLSRFIYSYRLAKKCLVINRKVSLALLGYWTLEQVYIGVICKDLLLLIISTFYLFLQLHCHVHLR